MRSLSAAVIPISRSLTPSMAGGSRLLRGSAPDRAALPKLQLPRRTRRSTDCGNSSMRSRPTIPSAARSGGVRTSSGGPPSSSRAR